MRKNTIKRSVAGILIALMVFNCFEPYYTLAQDTIIEEDGTVSPDSVSSDEGDAVSSDSIDGDEDDAVSSDSIDDDTDEAISSDEVPEEDESVSDNETISENDIDGDNPLPPEGFPEDFIDLREIPHVDFRNAEHIAAGSKSSASKIADLNVSVWGGLEGYTCPEELTEKEYSISYKNNKAASVKYDADGNVVPLYKSDAERPAVTVKGKGLYEGLTDTVYFEIYPLHLAANGLMEYSPDMEQKGFHGCLGGITRIKGLKRSYILDTKGHISEKVSLSVSKEMYYIDKTVTAKLKDGTDYTQLLYRWNSSAACWDKVEDPDINRISKTGDYLVVLEGKNNYWGTCCGNDDEWGNNGHNIEFNDGKNGGLVSPEHYDYQMIPEEGNWTGWQFRVTDKQELDLSKASVKIKNPVISYDGKFHDMTDFGLSVTVGKGNQKRELKEGVDYNITLRPDSCLYDNEYIKTGNDGGKVKVRVSNKYTVVLSAKKGSNYFGCNQAEKKIRIKGLVLKGQYFKCGIGDKFSKSAVFNGNQYEIRYELSASGKKAGLSFGDGEYGLYCANRKPYKAYAPGKNYIEVYAKGPAVDHSVSIKKLALYIKPGSLQSAVDKGLLSFTFSDAYYDSKGSYPQVTVSWRSPYSTYTQTFEINKNHFKKEINLFSSYYTMEFTFDGKNKKGGDVNVKVRCTGKGAFSGRATRDAGGARLHYHIN